LVVVVVLDELDGDFDFTFRWKTKHTLNLMKPQYKIPKPNPSRT
jgi:hypothetical protein